jgi:hypothetical protein
MQSNEILAVVDSVSTEKGLDKDIIFSAIEIAIASASQRHFHEDADLFVQIDRNTGEYSTHRNWIVFDVYKATRECAFWKNRNSSSKTSHVAKSKRS